jgi:hypothetical protein
MVSAARSKVRAVSKYALPRREIGIVMKPSRGKFGLVRHYSWRHKLRIARLCQT